MKELQFNSVSTYRNSGFHAGKRKFLRWDTVAPSLRTEVPHKSKNDKNYPFAESSIR